jgi:hypothetical protein
VDRWLLEVVRGDGVGERGGGCIINGIPARGRSVVSVVGSKGADSYFHVVAFCLSLSLFLVFGFCSYAMHCALVVFVGYFIIFALLVGLERKGGS